jgi:peptidylprolyl isomerase
MMPLRRISAMVLALVLGSGAALAQQGPSAKDLKAPPVLPKMAAPTNLPGMVATINDEDVLLLDLSNGGRVRIVMRPDVAPKHVERVRTLARQGFYDGTIFHRVIDGFMAQGGDPTGTGQGGSKLPDLTAEFNDLPHVRGAVSMARAQGLDSANSQFFIVFQPVLKLDRNYTVFGRVVSGMEFVDAIERGEPPENPTKIVKASIATDKVAPPAPASPIPAAALTPPPAPVVAAPPPAAPKPAAAKPAAKPKRK